MSAYLIAGAAGFLGSQIASRLVVANSHDRLVLLDSLGPTSHSGNIDMIVDHDRVISVVGDIRNAGVVNDLIRSHDITHIVQCAADAFVDGRAEDVGHWLDSNVVGTLTLLEAAKANWSRKQYSHGTHFHYVSCADILGPGKDNSIDDFSPAAPETLFASAKAAAEAYVHGYTNRYKMVTSISHPTNAFGPCQFPDKRIAAIICAMLEGKRVPIYGNGDEQINLVSVFTAAAAIVDICSRRQSFGRYGIAGETINLRDLAGMISSSIDMHFAEKPGLSNFFQRAPAAQNMSSRNLITMVQDRRQNHRPRHYDFKRLHDELGFPAYTSLSSDIHRTVGWYAAHPHWWRSIMDGSYRTKPVKMLMAG